VDCRSGAADAWAASLVLTYFDVFSSQPWVAGQYSTAPSLKLEHPVRQRATKEMQAIRAISGPP
jgi:hypothetical protein